MPALSTPSHEIFAQGLVAGLNASAAYEKAGYKPSGSSACNLRKNPDIKRRVEELTERKLGAVGLSERSVELAIERTGVTKERVINELAKLAFANMMDYMRVGPNGDPVTDFSQITRDQAAALQEVVVEDFVDGRGEDKRDVRRVRFKLHDKRGALIDIGKELGMFVNRTERGAPGEFAGVSDRQLKEELVKQLTSRGMGEKKAREFVGAQRGPGRPRKETLPPRADA